MDITPLISPHKKVIISYGNKQINVSNVIYKENLLVYDEQIFLWPVDINNISYESFSEFINTNNTLPEILLIGTGSKHQNISLELKNKFKACSITVEMMSTPAACRTFNVLVAEGREIALAVILV